MRTKKASLVIFCISIFMLIGACSAGEGNPITPGSGPDLSKYSSTVEGYIYTGSNPATSGHVYIYDLSDRSLFYEATIGSDGRYIAGLNAGQYLVFPFTRTGWRPPELEANYSSYINSEAENAYRVDIELNNSLPSGEELLFGFVTSSENKDPISKATVSAAGRSTKTDGYGFYSLAVPEGTSQITVTADGFFELNVAVHGAQATGDFFSTPFFELNPSSTSGSSIGGVIRDVFDGTGLGGVRVTLTLPSDVNFDPVRFLTNLGGEYRFFNLQEGIYRLYFERPGYVNGSRDGLVIKDQDDVIINVFMHRDDADRGNVFGYVNSAGVPLPINGARVTASNPLLGSYKSTTNPTGYYLLENVIPGNYTMTIVTPGQGVTFYEATSTFQTVVVGDNRVDFSLRFIDEGVLRGNVSIDGGGGGGFAFPPTGVEVIAEKVGGSMSGIKFKTTTDGKGIFVFNGIPMGFYKVSGRAEYSAMEIYSGTMYDVTVNSGSTTNVDLILGIN